MARKPLGGILRALRTLAFFSARRAIDMKVFQTLGLFAVHRAIACSLRSPERKRGQDQAILTYRGGHSHASFL